MRNDYRVLSKGQLDGPWDLAALRLKYLEGGFDGLNLNFMSPPPFENLDFLAEYADLKYLEITTRKLNNDIPAFRLPTLRELVLRTKSTRAIPGFASPDLATLLFDDRKGKEHLADLRSLRELGIWGYRGTDLRFLGATPPPVRVLWLNGMRQLITLDGLERCDSLRELEVTESRVESLRPLSALRELKAIRILPAYRAEGEVCLDLSDLVGLEKLEQLHLVYVNAIRSLQPLLEMPSLRELRLGPVTIVDGSLSVLNKLRSRVEIGGQLTERMQ